MESPAVTLVETQDLRAGDVLADGRVVTDIDVFEEDYLVEVLFADGSEDMPLYVRVEVRSRG